MRTHLFRAFLFVFLAVAVTLLPSLIRRWRRSEKIAPSTLQTLLSRQDPPLVLDVRNPDEFIGERGHITGAVLVPLPELENRLSELTSHRTRTIVAV